MGGAAAALGCGACSSSAAIVALTGPSARTHFDLVSDDVPAQAYHAAHACLCPMPSGSCSGGPRKGLSALAALG